MPHVKRIFIRSDWYTFRSEQATASFLTSTLSQRISWFKTFTFDQLGVLIDIQSFPSIRTYMSQNISSKTSKCFKSFQTQQRFARWRTIESLNGNDRISKYGKLHHDTMTGNISDHICASCQFVKKKHVLYAFQLAACHWKSFCVRLDDNWVNQINKLKTLLLLK